MMRLMFMLAILITLSAPVHAQTISIHWNSVRPVLGLEACNEPPMVDNSDSSMENALVWASNLHSSFNMHSKVYEKLLKNTCRITLTNPISIPKCDFIMDQWFAFLKPNAAIADVSGTQNLLVTAFKNQDRSRIIVVVNKASSSEIRRVFDVGAELNCKNCVTPFETTPQVSMASQQSISIVNGKFTYTIPATSVVTFSISTPYRGGQ